MSASTHFPDHTIDTAPAGSRVAMVNTQRRFGVVPPAVARLATSPQLLNGFLAASAAFEQTTLPPVAREVMIMTVAVRNGCQVCIGIHGAALKRLGAGDLITPLRDNRPLADHDHSTCPERERLEAVRVFTHQLIDTAGKVTDHDLDAFLAVGYTQQNALELVFGIGVYTMSTLANRLVGA
jgi:AhpD family alkylhydroperoxidase